MIHGYRPDLDGLRTVAVYLVLLFHAGLGWAGGGFVGVDLFFVLSGFLVTSVLVGEIERTGRLQIGRFYARRVRRLLPAAVVVVVATACAFTLLWSVVLRLGLVADARASLLYYANWHFLAASGDYFATDVDKSPFLHFWSLSIEEQYYVFFPLLLLVLTRIPDAVRRKATVAVLGALLLGSLALQVVLAQGSTDRAYYGTDTRLYQLLAGALLTVWLTGTSWRPSPRLAHRTALVGFVGVLVLGTGLLTISPSTRGVATTVAAILLLGGLATCEGTPLSRLLGMPVPAFLGRISYGTYLWHWPVIVALGVLLDSGPVVIAALAAVGATALAALSYELLEMPIRRAPRLNGYGWRVAVVGIASSALVASVGVPPVLSADRKPAVSVLGVGEQTSKTGAGKVDRALEQTIPDLDFAKATDRAERGQEHSCPVRRPRACTMVRGSGAHVLLVGDSQAETMVPAFIRLARAHDLTLSVNVVSGCPWAEGLVTSGLASRLHGDVKECRRARVDWYRKALPELDPDVVVLLNRPRDDSARWGKRITMGNGQRLTLAQATYRSTRNTLEEITEVAPAVVVQRLVVGEDFDPLECLSRSKKVSQCAVSASVDPSPTDGYVAALAAENPDIRPLSLGHVLCPTAPVCLPVVGRTVVWRDDHHYTATWATQRRQALWKSLRGTGLLS